ncbi:hypothetical protein [Clostridium sporogenes]|uniref:hypothetical protein n=1 Tax=Clostridium sporogenes TaxID=1509 RepID=UPI0001794D4A|nr:hypothetical protein [Clostridium sporogenes]EDU36035.1 hypothetical protein CLOSPO_02203 [Clostridium sporogenes ATCC 15579]MCW6080177.1 hypothetical protein [Clostridium sporogenes]MCW6095147.1 hypothetical protein [Clostridium sporogenes]MDU5013630.1 hypothetical protein [Clostridium botulinum]
MKKLIKYGKIIHKKQLNEKIILPLCLTVLVLVGCGTKSAVNIKNYNKLKYGMNYNEVKKILGEGQKKVVKIIKTSSILFFYGEFLYI